jgi:arylsulfatase A-like enzyme
LDTLNGDNAPHLILAFQEWTGTAKTGSGNQVWFGDHGGASWESHSVPLIMSGPGIRAGYVSSFPARLVDLAPTGLRLMGVPYPSLDGIALADAFTHPARNETRAQTAVAMHLTPVVAALKRQSQIDKSNLTVYGAVNPPLGSPATAQNSSTGAVY